MDLNLVDLYRDLMTLKTTLNNFELNEINLYVKINELKNYWNDKNTISFFSNIDIENRSTSSLINSINKYVDIYRYVYNKLSSYGKKIKVNFDNTYKINNNYNMIKQIYDAINAIYLNLDLKYCGEVSSTIYKQKSKYNENSKLLESYYNDYNKSISNIKSVENDVHRKGSLIDKIDIESINFQKLPSITIENGKVGMKSDLDIEDQLGLISTYIETEIELIDEINKMLKALNNDYISIKNSKLLNEIHQDFMISFKVLKNNHQDMIIYVNDLKNTYVDMVRKTVSSISDEIKEVL